MPTYEYICAKCGHEFEKIQSIADKSLTTCPADACAQKKWGRGRVTRKLSTGGGLIFKGSGFYTTDYRSENYKEAAKKDAAPAGTAGTSSKPASGGESKPAPAKADATPAKAPPKKSSA